jgi:hypothetical protein
MHTPTAANVLAILMIHPDGGSGVCGQAGLRTPIRVNRTQLAGQAA